MVPALLFQKVLVSYKEMRGPRLGLLLLGPPLRPETRRRLPPGRGAQMSQNLFKKTFFEPISVCCWPRLLVKIAPNRSFFTFGRPLPARNTSKVASGEGGPEVSKCMPEFTFGANLGVLLAQTFGENGSKSKLLHFLGSRWRPYVARMYPP